MGWGDEWVDWGDELAGWGDEWVDWGDELVGWGDELVDWGGEPSVEVGAEHESSIANRN